MIILFGNVGSGKGTQAELLARKLNCRTLSSGEILRQYKDRQDIQTSISKGELVADDILLPLVETEIKKAVTDRGEVILDGFPRNIAQAQWLIQMAERESMTITAVIHLVLPKETAMQRLLLRKRQDDTQAVIDQRFLEYEQKVLPAIDYLKHAGFEIKEINADQTVEEVAKDIGESLK